MDITVKQLSKAIQQGDINLVEEILNKACAKGVYCWLLWGDMTDAISYVFDRDFQSYRRFCSLSPVDQQEVIVELLGILIYANRRLSGYVDCLGGPAYLLAFAAAHGYLDLMETILNKMATDEMWCSVSFALTLLTTEGGLLAVQFGELPRQLRDEIEEMLTHYTSGCQFDEVLFPHDDGEFSSSEGVDFLL